MADCIDCKEKVYYYQHVSYVGMGMMVHINCWEHFVYNHPLAPDIMRRLKKEKK